MSVRNIAHGLFAGGALLLAAPLAAQDAADNNAAANEGTIVVTGQNEAPIDGGEVRSQARSITPRGSTIGQPLARFQQPICPGVWGLDAESAQLIIDRIYYNAEQIGLDLNEEAGCTANVLAVFVTDPHEEFAGLRTDDHSLVSGLSYWEQKRVSETEGPVLVWNAVSTRTRDGQARSGNPPVFDSTSISRTNSGTRRDLELSVVMIDSDTLGDMDGVAVADYVTMRTLARTNPPRGDAAYGTILALFDNPDDAPDRMSDFDMAYLRSLYAGRANMPANMALGGIDRLMEGGASRD